MEITYTCTSYFDKISKLPADDFDLFVLYQLFTLSSDKLVNQNTNSRSVPGKWYKPGGITHYAVVAN